MPRVAVLGAGMAGILAVWPWGFDRFRAEMAQPRLADYELYIGRSVDAEVGGG